jgi:sugar lactone lactonase YvrE
MEHRRIVLLFAAAGLLAGCSSQPSSSVPAAAPNTGQSIARANLASHDGRFVYVADIDGQPGVGQVLVYTGDMQNPQFVRAITTGTGRPFGLWVDGAGTLYVANEPDKYEASVAEFKPGASSPFFFITSFKGYPASVAVGTDRVVYVNESDEDEGYVQVFAPGSAVAKRTIDTHVGGYAFTPGSMAFDRQGNLVVAEQAGLKLQIVEIIKGTSKVKPLNLDLNGNNITGPGLGIDKAGNMYVGSSSTETVSVFAPGQTEPSRTISPVAAYGLMNVLPDGTVYEASGEYTVTEIAPGSNSPTTTFSCQCSAQGVAASR